MSISEHAQLDERRGRLLACRRSSIADTIDEASRDEEGGEGEFEMMLKSTSPHGQRTSLRGRESGGGWGKTDLDIGRLSDSFQVKRQNRQRRTQHSCIRLSDGGLEAERQRIQSLFWDLLNERKERHLRQGRLRTDATRAGRTLWAS
jgi:hypothetical protein